MKLILSVGLSWYLDLYGIGEKPLFGPCLNISEIGCSRLIVLNEISREWHGEWSDSLFGRLYPHTEIDIFGFVSHINFGMGRKLSDFCMGFKIRQSNPKQVVHYFQHTVTWPMIHRVFPLTVHNRLIFVVNSTLGHYPISIWLTEIVPVMGLDWISVLQHVPIAHAGCSGRTLHILWSQPLATKWRNQELWQRRLP